MVTVAELNDMLEEEIIRLMCLGFDVEPTDEVVQINRRKGCYGVNKFHRVGNDYHHTIYISKYYLDAPKEELRTVLAHEAAHSVKGSTGHDRIWIRAVTALKMSYNYVNAEYHLNAHPYSRNRNKQDHTDLIAADSVTYKYVFVCDGCGQTIHYTRKSKFVQHPERYHCIHCHGKFHQV